MFATVTPVLLVILAENAGKTHGLFLSGQMELSADCINSQVMWNSEGFVWDQ